MEFADSAHVQDQLPAADHRHPSPEHVEWSRQDQSMTSLHTSVICLTRCDVELQTVRMFKTNYRLLITGTPLQNMLSGLGKTKA